MAHTMSLNTNKPHGGDEAHPVFWCGPCGAKLKGVSNVIRHMSGKTHQNKVRGGHHRNAEKPLEISVVVESNNEDYQMGSEEKVGRWLNECEQPDLIAEMDEHLNEKIELTRILLSKDREIKKLKGQLLDSEVEVKKKLNQYSKTQRGLMLSVLGRKEQKKNKKQKIQ